MKTLKALMLLLALSACTNVEQKISDTYYDLRDNGIPAMGETLSGKPTAETLLNAGRCPTVEIDKDLGTFYNIGNGPVSSLTMSQRNTCSFGPKSVTADVQLAFTDSGNSPPSTYPYFVAVLAPGGKILAKDMFAISTNGGGGTQIETIRQIIPASGQKQAAAHKIMIGFQLSDQQIAYIRDQRKQQEQLANAQRAQYQRLLQTNPQAAANHPGALIPAARSSSGSSAPLPKEKLNQ